MLIIDYFSFFIYNHNINHISKMWLMLCSRVPKKVDRDKDEMKRWWWWVHTRKRKKSDIWSQKKYHSLYYSYFNFFLDWSQKTGRLEEIFLSWWRKINCITNCSPPLMQVFFDSPESWVVTFPLLGTNWLHDTLKILRSHVWLFLVPTVRVEMLLKSINQILTALVKQQQQIWFGFFIQ